MGNYRPFTLAETARRLNGLWSAQLRDFWVCIGDFLDDWYAADQYAREEMLGGEPPATFDPRFDAYLAALAEHLALTSGLPVPAWAGQPQRFLEQFWFPTEFGSLHALALVQSPAAFRRRGIFVDHTAFARLWEGSPGLTRDEIITVLTALGQKLVQEGILGEMYLVDGAAMALAYDVVRVTRDVDAVFVPKHEIYRAARELAEELGLPQMWLGDAVKGFLAGKDRESIPVLEVPGLRVMAASPRHMLAMKCLAGRLEDESDIRYLVGLLGTETFEAALALVESVYPQRPIPARARFLLEELLTRGAFETPQSPRVRSLVLKFVGKTSTG